MLDGWKENLPNFEKVAGAFLMNIYYEPYQKMLNKLSDDLDKLKTSLKDDVVFQTFLDSGFEEDYKKYQKEYLLNMSQKSLNFSKLDLS